MASEDQHTRTPLITPTLSEDIDHPLTHHPHHFSFFQSNCHDRYDSTMSVLNTELTHIALLLQKPWTNPYDWLPPTHPNWHRYAPRLTPTNRNERTRACIYINRSVPTHQILYLPDNNNLLSWVPINNIHPAVPKVTLLSLYNTPTKFDGPPLLQTWLNNMIHPHIPQTGPNGRPTTIDLTWANHIARHLHPETSTRLNNHSSDHQPIMTKIKPPDSGPRQEAKHLSVTIGKLDHKAFLSSLQGKLDTHTLCPLDANTTTISQATDNLTEAVCTAYESQGKWVRTNQHRMKPWWNTSVLNPLVKERNSARRKMLRTKTQESTLNYYCHQEIFKQKVWELKTLHWRRFLADKGPDHAFQAYNFTKSRSTSEICALKAPGGHVATDTTKKATILFEAICNLPNKKAAGPDRIPNELLKIATETIVPHLVPLFNACLQTHQFLTQWKQATKVIIKKAAKAYYTDPNAYRPIALLSTLGKLFKKIINDQLTYWAEQTKALHPGHVGGRPGRSINDAFTILSSWIHHKWRENKIVIGTFLDVKSAYPTVHKKRLIHSLLAQNCPPYLYLIIDSFLTDRTTKLRLDQFTSHEFNIPTGLPQGSPLSVILYLLYNYDLLIPGPPSLDKNTMSIAYVDEVTHLLAENSLKEGMEELGEVLRHSLDWGRRHGSIFDKNKTNLILFTKRKITPPLEQFGDQDLTFSNKVKWLGITLTPTLTFGKHLKNLKQ
ncbi:hypothetical protein O181_059875 [Austropuccinia psidii MF-1]|uniref:Reverse transcriptase domain-containing protein n=1 Tax=Austropuccinia psidii MF-1 TaxID=1389203 RepID=A0A9Q3EJA6_9BASI|nr:hypothetical protein [Austropuccinia psidii MF-1]